VSGDWASVSAELIPVALVVALSPISVLPALLLVLYSTRPRATSLTFLSGWLVGLVVSTVVFLNVPKLLGDRAGGLGGSQFGLRVTFGAVLILTGVVLWLRRAHTARNGWLDRVATVSPAVTGGLGLAFAIANPKILVACAAAGLAIGTSALGPTGRGFAVAYFVVLAGSTTALPVVAHLVAATRLDRSLERLRQWIQRRQNEISAVALVLIGLVMVASGFGSR
jgi:hypothetical protein